MEKLPYDSFTPQNEENNRQLVSCYLLPLRLIKSSPQKEKKEKNITSFNRKKHPNHKNNFIT